ncbi:MAG: DUF559 domain-containing protein [Clostridiales bacterium]|nr:DUF559 domain-containing protein [Clostridiales bacterium]
MQKLTPVSKVLRKNMTPEERHLWYDFLISLSVTVRRQMVISEYIVDFCIPKYRIIIELDGKQHETPVNQHDDYVRDSFLAQQGYEILRYPNSMIRNSFRRVCEDIQTHINNAPAYPEKFF